MQWVQNNIKTEKDMELYNSNVSTSCCISHYKSESDSVKMLIESSIQKRRDTEH
jgi:hypothetical protein